MKKTLYQKTRLGKVQEWTIWVVEKGDSGFPEVWTSYGQTDGKKQSTNDVVKEGVNIGKSNETSAFEQSLLMAERRIVKQLEHGYVEKIEDANKQILIDFEQPFPKELCFYKPQNSIEDKKISELEKSGRSVFTIKRDGMMHIIRKSDKFGVEIYSRRMDLVSDKYPHIVEALSKVKCNFVLLGEIILDNNGKDDFNTVSSICRSDPEVAIAKQKELGLVKYYVFDMAFIENDGEYCNLLTTEPYINRLNIFEDKVKPYLKDNSVITRCEILNYDDDHTIPLNERRNKTTYKEAFDEIKKRKLEGLVIWDAESKMDEGQAFTMNGKPYKPNCLWKRKPKYEDDFIVRFNPENGIGDYGKGKNKGKFGNGLLYQIDDDGKEVFITKCGGGLSDKQREFYLTAEYPRVWRVEYDSILKGTGALRFPVFNADRTIIGDKMVSECLMSQAIKKARSVGEKNEKK